jgi:hypothetical protein
MTTRYSLLLLMFLAWNAFSGAPADRVADLQPGLKQALMRDDACVRKTLDNDQSEELQSPVVAQPILAAGREAGIIADMKIAIPSSI